MATQLSLLPSAAAAREARRGVMRARNSYEAASMSRRTLGWRPSSTTPNSAVIASLSTLRTRSRYAVANDGVAKGAIEKLVTNVVGTGVKPLSKAPDAALRETLHRLWLQWTDQSDADGVLDFYGQQGLATRGWFEGGETFIRLRDRLPSDGLVVPLQVQLLEAEMCPHTHNATLPNGNRIRAGIEFNRIGQRVAYWFHPSTPGALDDYDMASLRRVPAANVIHLYDPLRPGQLRGLPHLTTALVRLHHVDKMDDTVLLRQELSNMFVGFLKRAPETEDPQIDPISNEAISTVDDEASIELKGGAFHELAPGEELEWSEPPDPSQSYPDFMRLQLRAVSMATGVPYEILTGDMTGMNDRTVRVVLHEFRRRVQAWQHQVIAYQLCRRVWNAWLTRGYLAGAFDLPKGLEASPDVWSAVKWVPQGFPYLHPVQDVDAAKAAIRSGLKSRQSVVSEMGEDAEVIDREQADDAARADDLQLKYDSDGRFPASASIITAADLAEGVQQ